MTAQLQAAPPLTEIVPLPTGTTTLRFLSSDNRGGSHSQTGLRRRRAVVSSGVHKGSPVLCVGRCQSGGEGLLPTRGGGTGADISAPCLWAFNLSKRPAADICSSSMSMLPHLSATDPSAGTGVVMSGGGAVTETRERLRFSHALYWDDNQAADLLSSCLPPFRHVLIEIHPIAKRLTVIRTPWISQRLLRRPSGFSQSQSFANTEK